MNHTIKQIFAISLLAASMSMMTGCSPKIDASSKNVTASIDKVKEGHDKDDVTKFNDSLNSIIDYSYAKTHDGKLPKDSDNILVQFSDLINDKMNPNNQKTADQIISDAINGLTFDDVIRLKPKYDSMTADLVKQRKILVDKKQAEIAVQKEKEHAVQEQLLKEQAKQRVVADIANTKLAIASADKDIENYEVRLKPYADAEKTFEKITSTNINVIPSVKGKQWLISFDLENSTDFPVYNVGFDVTTSAEGVNASTVGYNEDIPDGLTNKISHTVMVDKTTSNLKKVDDSSSIKVSVAITHLTTKIEVADLSGALVKKEYSFDKPVNGTYGPDFMNKAVITAKHDKDVLVKNLADLETKKTELFK